MDCVHSFPDSMLKKEESRREEQDISLVLVILSSVNRNGNISIRFGHLRCRFWTEQASIKRKEQSKNMVCLTGILSSRHKNRDTSTSAERFDSDSRDRLDNVGEEQSRRCTRRENLTSLQAHGVGVHAHAASI